MLKKKVFLTVCIVAAITGSFWIEVRGFPIGNQDFRARTIYVNVDSADQLPIDEFGVGQNILGNNDSTIEIGDVQVFKGWIDPTVDYLLVLTNSPYAFEEPGFSITTKQRPDVAMQLDDDLFQYSGYELAIDTKIWGEVACLIAINESQAKVLSSLTDHSCEKNAS